MSTERLMDALAVILINEVGAGQQKVALVRFIRGSAA